MSTKMFTNISKKCLKIFQKNVSNYFKKFQKYIKKFQKKFKKFQKKFKKISKKYFEKIQKNISKKRRRRFWMTKNHFNGKKSIFQVFLGYAVKNSKNFPDQDHTVANLLRSGITDFRDVPRFSSYLTRYTHINIYIYIYLLYKRKSI